MLHWLFVWTAVAVAHLEMWLLMLRQFYDKLRYICWCMLCMHCDEHTVHIVQRPTNCEPQYCLTVLNSLLTKWLTHFLLPKYIITHDTNVWCLNMTYGPCAQLIQQAHSIVSCCAAYCYVRLRHSRWSAIYRFHLMSSIMTENGWSIGWPPNEIRWNRKPSIRIIQPFVLSSLLCCYLYMWWWWCMLCVVKI